MKKIIIFVLAVSITHVGCSSTPPVKGYQEDEVLSTVNNSSQPGWADETKPFLVKDGKVYSVGITTLRGSDRPEAGARIAENNARANLAKAIENRMEFSFQNAEEDVGIDSRTANYIGSEVSQLTSHSMTVEGHWWKRYAQSNEDGSRAVLYKVYSLVTMPEPELKRAINAAMTKKGMSTSFQAKVDKQWDRFVEGKNLSQVASQAAESGE